MGKVLAYAGAEPKNLVGSGLYFGLAWFVGELRINVSDYSIGVVSYIFDDTRTSHPEKFSKRLTEWYVPARAQKIVLGLVARAVVEEKSLERGLNRRWRLNLQSF